jgi:type IV pilus assembly protein PilV
MSPPQALSTLRAMPCATRRARGFTLIEVMVALFVTAVGLLGIAKMQALAYASTGSASVRSLVALQAAGLAASMHANRNYWGGTAALTAVAINGPTVTGGILQQPANCTAGNGAPCSSNAMATYDLQNYANNLNQMLGNSSPITNITCSIAAAGNPVSCIVQVTWNEKAVSINSTSVAATTQSTFTPTYTLYVEP